MRDNFLITSKRQVATIKSSAVLSVLYVMQQNFPDCCVSSTTSSTLPTNSASCYWRFWISARRSTALTIIFCYSDWRAQYDCQAVSSMGYGHFLPTVLNVWCTMLDVRCSSICCAAYHKAPLLGRCFLCCTRRACLT